MELIEICKSTGILSLQNLTPEFHQVYEVFLQKIEGKLKQQKMHHIHCANLAFTKWFCLYFVGNTKGFLWYQNLLVNQGSLNVYMYVTEYSYLLLLQGHPLPH